MSVRLNMSADLMCLCGKKKGALNDTNWIRHKTTCKVIKLNSSKNIFRLSCMIMALIDF